MNLMENYKNRYILDSFIISQVNIHFPVIALSRRRLESRVTYLDLALGHCCLEPDTEPTTNSASRVAVMAAMSHSNFASFISRMIN